VSGLYVRRAQNNAFGVVMLGTKLFNIPVDEESPMTTSLRFEQLVSATQSPLP
jgi:hypothetical protein